MVLVDVPVGRVRPMIAREFAVGPVFAIPHECISEAYQLVRSELGEQAVVAELDFVDDKRLFTFDTEAKWACFACPSKDYFMFNLRDESLCEKIISEVPGARRLR